MSVDAKHKTAATATGGGRDGKTTLAGGTLSLDLIVPKELGDPGGYETRYNDCRQLGVDDVIRLRQRCLRHVSISEEPAYYEAASS